MFALLLTFTAMAVATVTTEPPTVKVIALKAVTSTPSQPGPEPECVVWEGREFCAMVPAKQERGEGKIAAVGETVVARRTPRVTDANSTTPTPITTTDTTSFGEEPAPEVGSKEWYTNLGISCVCIVTAGMAAGLTMGLVSIDSFQLHIVIEAELDDCKSEKEKRDLLNEKYYAQKVLPLVHRHHWLLVTLLLLNAVANEALPLFLDKLGLSQVLTIVISVTFVLFFGEIIPSAIFTGPSQLRVSSTLTPFVWFIMILFAPIAWPISKLLDSCFGHEEMGSLSRTQLKAIVKMHGAPGKHGKEAKEVLRLGGLTEDEVTILHGVLDMTYLTAQKAMIPLSKVFMLDAEDTLDFDTMAKIIGAGHSRVPVYRNDKHNIIGLLLVKKLIVLDPEDKKRVGDFVFRQPCCVTPDMNLLDVLNQFQEQRTHLAVVTDNPKALERALKDHDTPVPPDVYLGGILCIEDVMEKLIGEEIYDETDSSKESKQLHKASALANKIKFAKLRGKRSSVGARPSLAISPRTAVKAFENPRQTESLNTPLLGDQFDGDLPL